MAADKEYIILTALRKHQYRYNAKTRRPDDPGWNACDCGWEGYWCDFHPHLTEEIVKKLEEAGF